MFRDEEDRKSTTGAAADGPTKVGDTRFWLFNNQKYCLDAGEQGKKSLFIGKFNRKPKRPDQTIPVVIRRYTIESVDKQKIERELQALRSPKNNHENFIQYFDCNPSYKEFT